MKRKPFTKDELKHLKYLLKTRDNLSDEEASKHIDYLIQSQKTLPTPPRNPKSTTFKEEFLKIKSPRKNLFGDA